MALYGVSPMLPGGPDEDLLRQMQLRRSGQAGQLQAQQAAMGVPGQIFPGTGGPPGPQLSGGGRQDSRVMALLNQRREEMAGLEGQRAGLNMGQRLLQILDPRLPKPARQFLFRELSREVGVDPRGPRSKELGQMITSLDPEVLEGMRRRVATEIQGNPGQVPNLVRGVMTGQVPVNNLIGAMVQPGLGQAPPGGGEAPPAGVPPPGEGAGTRPPGMMRLGGPETTPGEGAGGLTGLMTRGLQETSLRQPGRTGTTIPGRRDEGPHTIPPTSPPTAEITPEARNIPPIMREISTDLAAMLGLDPTERYRNIDVIRGGWRNIPTDTEGQTRMANDFRPLRDGVINSIVMGNQLVDLFRGRPEVLNVNVGRLPYIGDVQLPNPSSAVVQARDWASGIARTFGSQGFSTERDSEATGRILSMSDELARRISERAYTALTGRVGQQEAANINAQIQSLLINMAFAMAASKGQTGRFLSDRDVELQLQELGRSASPEQFEAVVNGVMNRIYNQYRVRTRSATGGDVSIIPALTPEAASVIVNGRATPRGLLTEIEGAGFVRPAPEVSPEALGSMGARNILRATPGLPGRQDEAEVIPPSERVVSIPEGGTPYTRIERIPNVPTIVQEEETLRRRTAEDRAIVLNREARENRRTEIAESAERRAARGEIRAEEELRRRRIHEAFQAISQSLRSSGSTSVNIPSGGTGGEQDAAAFRIAPPPQRRPPEPIDASRFRR